eukprot:scaffold160343_cov35-Tisochrysis_lutea.AAC.3
MMHGWWSRAYLRRTKWRVPHMGAALSPQNANHYDGMAGGEWWILSQSRRSALFARSSSAYTRRPAVTVGKGGGKNLGVCATWSSDVTACKIPSNGDGRSVSADERSTQRVQTKSSSTSTGVDHRNRAMRGRTRLEEGCVDIICNSTRQKGLPGSRRPVKKASFGCLDAHAYKELWVDERQLDHLAHLADLLIEAAYARVRGSIGLLSLHVEDNRVDLSGQRSHDGECRHVQRDTSTLN